MIIQSEALRNDLEERGLPEEYFNDLTAILSEQDEEAVRETVTQRIYIKMPNPEEEGEFLHFEFMVMDEGYLYGGIHE